MKRTGTICKILDEPAVVRAGPQETSYLTYIARLRPSLDGGRLVRVCSNSVFGDDVAQVLHLMTEERTLARMEFEASFVEALKNAG
jgi:hypothetical protein